MLVFLCDDCREHFQRVQDYLKDLQVSFTLDPYMVRGLDYYVKTAFEVLAGIYTQDQIAGWRKVVDAVHAKGGIIFLEHWHGGRVTHSSFQPGGVLPVAPSAIAISQELKTSTADGKVTTYETPRALETAEVAAVVRDYRRATERAKAAGFDGVEIHAANAYLIDQFLQSRTNHRTDRYGGSLENRLRFLQEIVEATITVLPANRVGVRLSPNGNFNDMASRTFFPAWVRPKKVPAATASISPPSNTVSRSRLEI